VPAATAGFTTSDCGVGGGGLDEAVAVFPLVDAPVITGLVLLLDVPLLLERGKTINPEEFGTGVTLLMLA